MSIKQSQHECCAAFWINKLNSVYEEKKKYDYLACIDYQLNIIYTWLNDYNLFHQFYFNGFLPDVAFSFSKDHVRVVALGHLLQILPTLWAHINGYIMNVPDTAVLTNDKTVHTHSHICNTPIKETQVIALYLDRTSGFLLGWITWVSVYTLVEVPFCALYNCRQLLCLTNTNHSNTNTESKNICSVMYCK